MLIYNAPSMFIYVMKYVSVFITKLWINFAVCIKWIDETQWNNRFLLVTNCYEDVAIVARSDCYGCAIVMSYTGINKAVPQWLLTFSLCGSVTWPWTCMFHISCMHTHEITDMHRGGCDNPNKRLVHWDHNAQCFIIFCPPLNDAIGSPKWN